MEKEIQQAIDLLLQHGYEVTPPQSEEELNNEFECWWNMYDKKCGKIRCLRKWVNMPKKIEYLVLQQHRPMLNQDL